VPAPLRWDGRGGRRERRRCRRHTHVPARLDGAGDRDVPPGDRLVLVLLARPLRPLPALRALGGPRVLRPAYRSATLSAPPATDTFGGREGQTENGRVSMGRRGRFADRLAASLRLERADEIDERAHADAGAALRLVA